MKEELIKVDVSNLWVGERLKVISTGEEGRFRDVSEDGRLLIKVGHELKTFSIDEVIVWDQEEEIEDLLDFEFEKESGKRPVPQRSFSKEIDLHIEKLNPGLQNAHPQLILDHQLQVCREFLNDAIVKRRSVVTIIHGKGTGILKEEVLHMLKEFKNIRFSIEVNNGGAHEVWMRY